MKKVREYILEHGLGSPAPELSLDLSPDIFRLHYYDIKTLIKFCRLHNIPTQGLKNEISKRIEFFLKEGKVPDVKPSKRKSAVYDSQLGLTLDQQVVNYKSDPATRAFFAKHINGFSGFSAYVQKWLKKRLDEGDVFTYAEVIEEHKRFMKEKAEGKLSNTPQKVAHDSCQQNQFCLDYAADGTEKPHSVKEAWKLIRDSAGDKTYARYKNEIEAIIKLFRE